jgi:hypothetical protein
MKMQFFHMKMRFFHIKSEFWGILAAKTAHFPPNSIQKSPNPGLKPVKINENPSKSREIHIKNVKKLQFLPQNSHFYPQNPPKTPKNASKTPDSAEKTVFGGTHIISKSITFSHRFCKSDMSASWVFFFFLWFFGGFLGDFWGKFEFLGRFF